MSDTEDCIRRLSKMYQDGTHSVSWDQLFPDTNLTHSQIQSKVQFLESKLIIKCNYRPRHIFKRDELIIPENIQILPGVIDAADAQIDKSNPAEQLKRKLMSYHVIAWGTLALIVAAAILGLLDTCKSLLSP